MITQFLALHRVNTWKLCGSTFFCTWYIGLSILWIFFLLSKISPPDPILKRNIIIVHIMLHALSSGHTHLVLPHLIITITHNNPQSKQPIWSILHSIFSMQFYTYKTLSHLEIAPNYPLLKVNIPIDVEIQMEQKNICLSRFLNVRNSILDSKSSKSTSIWSDFVNALHVTSKVHKLIF